MSVLFDHEETEIVTSDKDIKLEILLSPHEASLMELAASLTGKSFSEFVAESACARAKFMLGNRSRVEMDSAGLAVVLEAMERSGLKSPRLQKILGNSSGKNRRAVIEKLDTGHSVIGFDCGYRELNNWLSKLALASQFMDYADTYAVQIDGAVVGYYALTIETFAIQALARDTDAETPSQFFSARILLRLAVDQKHQKMGLGRILIRNAVMRFARDAKTNGTQVLIVHAKDEAVRDLYFNCGFTPLPSEPLLLFITLNDILKTAENPGIFGITP